MKLSELNPNQYKEIEQPKTGLGAGIGTFAKGVGVGVLKTAGETALGAGQLGRGIQNALPSWMSTLPGNRGESIFDAKRAQEIRDTTLAANAPGQGTGKFLGTAAQYLLPTSGITRGQQILGAAASKVPTTLGRITAQGAARFLPEAVGTGGVSFVRSGGDVEQAKQEGMLAGGFSVGLGALGGLARSTYWPVLDESVNKALGVQGKKSGSVALNQTAQKTSGLQVLKDRAKDLTVKLEDGSIGNFDPAKATYNTTLQAWKAAKEKIFNEYTNLATKAGDKATIDLSELRQQIVNSLDAPILSVEKNAVRSILKDFDEIFSNPNTVDLQTAERFVKSLNDNTVQGFFTGTSDAASSKVFAGTARLIREKLDDAITENTGKGYQALRSQYAALKSIEDDLVRKFQQDARQIGGGLPEYTGAFASGDIIGSALALDPAQFAKGTTLGVFAALKRKLSNPERFLRRSFDLMDDIPSDLYLRIFGGQSSLDDVGKKMADDIADSLNNPAMGLSIKETGNVSFDELTSFIQRQTKTAEDMRARGVSQNSSAYKKIEQSIKDALKRRDALPDSFKKGEIPSTNLLENIDKRLQPLVDKDGMIDVYRVAAKHPKDVYPKDTFFATKENTARYYGESWHKGNPADLEMRKIKIPANLLKRGGSNDAWQLKEEVPVSGFQLASTNLLEEAKKYKSAGDFFKSKMINGYPLYHGSDKEITKFKLPQEQGLYGKGVYFYADEAEAKNFVSMLDNSEITRAFPINKNFATNKQFDDAILKAKKTGLSPSKAKDAATKQLSSEGYIGIEDDGLYVVFNPDDIKSITEMWDIWSASR